MDPTPGADLVPSLQQSLLLTRQFQVTLDHRTNQFLETNFGLPPEYLPGLTSISLKKVHFCRPEIAGIGFNATLPVDPGKARGEVQKLSYRVTLTRCDDIITW